MTYYYVLEGTSELCPSKGLSCVLTAHANAEWAYDISSNGRVAIKNTGPTTTLDLDSVGDCNAEVNQIISFTSTPPNHVSGIFMSSNYCDDLNGVDGFGDVCGRTTLLNQGGCRSFVRERPFSVGGGNSVIAHEIGHNLGLSHAGSYEILPNGQPELKEYGDWSLMGNPKEPYPVSFPQRILLGYLTDHPTLVRRLVPTGPNSTFAAILYDCNVGDINTVTTGELSVWFNRDKESNYVVSYQGEYTGPDGFYAPASLSVHYMVNTDKYYGSDYSPVSETNEVAVVWRTEKTTCQFPIKSVCSTTEWTSEDGLWTVEVLSQLGGSSVSLLVSYEGGGSTREKDEGYPYDTCGYTYGPSFYSDGYCDVKLNNEECGYDGGDCCPDSCVSGVVYKCGYFGYDCGDPKSEYFGLYSAGVARGGFREGQGWMCIGTGLVLTAVLYASFWGSW